MVVVVSYGRHQEESRCLRRGLLSNKVSHKVIGNENLLFSHR